MRLLSSLRSIQAQKRHLALPLALVYVALIALLAFGHRCPSQRADAGSADWPEPPPVELNVPPYQGPGIGLLSTGHTDSGAEHRCALCALHHQESAPPSRAHLVRLTASPPLPFLVAAPSPLTGAPLTATSRGPPRV